MTYSNSNSNSAMINPLLIVLFVFMTLSHGALAQDKEPVSIGVIGLTHTHVHWIFESEKRGEIDIVAIVEPNKALAKRYAEQHGYDMSSVFDSMEDMIARVKPQGVTAFGSIYEHLRVVEFAAPRGIHVMVEKPLAVSLEHALKMSDLAKKHNIHLLTNYETTWYPSNHYVKQVVDKGQIGDVRKVVVHDGHKGPKKLGINSEFLDWLTDPKLNGGGAIIDFGCYGANLMTWLMDGEAPLSVTAITQQFQPHDYPNVDDEATIILTYPKAQAIIQASWNWPIARKDMEVYGETGVVMADNRHNVRIQVSDTQPQKSQTLAELVAPHDDPFALFAAVIKGNLVPDQNDLNGLHNNLTVMHILDAAVISAKTGKTVHIEKP